MGTVIFVSSYNVDQSGRLILIYSPARDMINNLICRRQFVADTKPGRGVAYLYCVGDTNWSVTIYTLTQSIVHTCIACKDISKNAAYIKRSTFNKREKYQQKLSYKFQISSLERVCEVKSECLAIF